MRERHGGRVGVVTTAGMTATASANGVVPDKQKQGHACPECEQYGSKHRRQRLQCRTGR